MRIAFTCSACDRLFVVPGEAAGRKTACPSCETPLTVPEQSEKAALAKLRENQGASSDSGSASGPDRRGPRDGDPRPVGEPPAAPQSLPGAETTETTEAEGRIEHDGWATLVRQELIPSASRYKESAGRYREMVWYLMLGRWLASIYLILAVTLPPLWFVWTIAQDIWYANESWGMLVLRVVGALLICLLALLTAILLRIVVQSVDVILDLEANTRKTAERLADVSVSHHGPAA